MAFVLRLLKNLQTRTRRSLAAPETRQIKIGKPERVTSRPIDDFDDDEILSAPFNIKYEVSASEFSIDQDKILGSGKFSIVYHGHFREMDVAIKTTKSTADLVYLLRLSRELKMMTHTGKHPNIILLFGATRRIEYKIVYAIFELGVHGDLNSFLMDHRSNFVDTLSASQLFNFNAHEINSNDYENLPLKPTISTRDLVKWCGQIAAGMSHLASKKIIHGNLTARNVFVFDDYTVKIGGFSDARKLQRATDTDYTMKQKQAPISWRIMAPESLKYLTFSTKSDVWAFGVLTWEIFSLAEIPYSDLTSMLDFVGNLEHGLRLQKPKWASNEIYGIMSDCWHREPQGRPDFDQLENFYHRYGNSSPIDCISKPSYSYTWNLACKQQNPRKSSIEGAEF